MKTIALMPVKNAEWILDKSLTALSQFCDVIIVAEQNSSDSTPEILQRFPKVLIIENTQKFLNHGVRMLLLDAARNFDGHNLIFCVDADEIPAATILLEENFRKFCDMAPGTGGILPWIQLWRSPVVYRNDGSIWSNSQKHFVFRDDRKSWYKSTGVAIDHAARIPTDSLSKSSYIPEVPILHYQFVQFDRMLAKQRWYRVVEELTTLKTPEAINSTYILTKDERGIRCDPIPRSWVDGWVTLGIDVEHFETQPLYWYEQEILEIFEEYGAAKFADLDIWDVDWEAKRKIANSLDSHNIISEKIRDPRRLDTKLYHWYLGKYFRTPIWYWGTAKIKTKLLNIVKRSK